MNTNSGLRVAAASVIGARHQRAGRNGQDAAFVWCRDAVAVAVVCDGCSSGASSEVGARLAARLFAHELGDRLVGGACVRERSIWEDARGAVARQLAPLVVVRAQPDAVTTHDPAAPGGLAARTQPVDAARVHDLLLCTIVAAAVTARGAAAWALGDGAYACDGATHVLGPFADNEPPYLGYDLLGAPAVAHFEILPDDAHRIVVATDGAADLDHDLGVFAGPTLTAHPDGLRRRLAQLARHEDRIDWSERRVLRSPARLQDDCAVAIIERSVEVEAEYDVERELELGSERGGR